jgi:hypothetical protein
MRGASEKPEVVCPSRRLSRADIGCPVCGWADAGAFHVILHMRSELQRLRQKFKVYEKEWDFFEKCGKQKPTGEPCPVCLPVPVFFGG